MPLSKQVYVTTLVSLLFITFFFTMILFPYTCFFVFFKKITIIRQWHVENALIFAKHEGFLF